MFENQSIAFGYFLRPDAAPESRLYQELPATASQLVPLLETYLDAYNNRFNTSLNLGKMHAMVILYVSSRRGTQVPFRKPKCEQTQCDAMSITV